MICTLKILHAPQPSRAGTTLKRKIDKPSRRVSRPIFHANSEVVMKGSLPQAPEASDARLMLAAMLRSKACATLTV